MSTVFLVNPASANGSTGAPGRRSRTERPRRASEGETLFSEGPGGIAHVAERACAGWERSAWWSSAGTGPSTRRPTASSRSEPARRSSSPSSRAAPGRTSCGPSGSRRSRRGDRGRARRRRARDRRGQGLLPSLGRLGGKRVLRQRRKRRDERRERRCGRTRRRRRSAARRRSSGRRWRSSPAGRTSRSPWTSASEHREGSMLDVIVANCEWLGGGMRMTPNAKPDDGVFDVLLIGDVTKRDLVQTLPKIYRGTHLPHPKAEELRGRDGARRCRDPAPRRARRGAARDDARDLRGRAGRPPPARPAPRKRSSRVRCRRRWSGRARATEPSPRPS